MTAPGLRRFLQARPRPQPGEVCEMCAERLSSEHSHVIDLESRSIMCTCRGCYLLFTRPGAGAQRRRAVPDRYLYAPSFSFAEALWEDIGIPVRMAFFFTNSSLEKTVAFYPSPAGATESLLPLGAWEDILKGNDELSTVEPDVEALLVNKLETGFECFLVPIVACYELVGLVKLKWKGFDGGTDAWEAINGFFADLRERSKIVGEANG